MYLKKLLPTSIGLVLAITGSALAQQTTTPQTDTNRSRQDGLRRRGLKQRRGDKREMRAGLQQLNLTDDQKKQRHAILETHLAGLKSQRDQLFEIRQRRLEGSLTAEDREKARSVRQQLRASMQDMRSQMRNTLTTEQRSQLDALQEQRKQRRLEMMKQRQEFRRSRPQE
jgi:Spy/CpxP family protein refolding chaperone